MDPGENAAEPAATSPPADAPVAPAAPAAPDASAASVAPAAPITRNTAGAAGTPPAASPRPASPPAGSAARETTPLPRRQGVFGWLALLLVLGLAAGFGLRWLQDHAGLFSGLGGSGGSTTVPVAIHTDPPAATVMVDGVIVGQSPVAAAQLTAGLHSLRVEKAGFQPLVTPLTVAAGVAPPPFQLTPVAFARLEVASTPPGAQVYVDGNFQGVSPLTVARLAPGIHDLLVEKTNYTTHQSRYSLRAGEVRQVVDIVLENKLLLMLKANLEISPRSIGNYLDLAHFYYVNNDMTTAVKYYLRARELASLPMPPPPAGTPPEDIAFQQQLFQDEIRRVKTEEDHHYQNYREYYGNGLDFDTFRREYAKGVEEFNRWAGGIQDLQWVLDQGRAKLAAGDAARAVELFADYTPKNADSGVALGCETAALIHAGKLAEARERYPRALAALAKDNPAALEKKYAPTAWRLMGVAWRAYGLQAVGATQQPALDNAAHCLQTAVKTSSDPLDMAQAQFESARLAYDRRQTEEYPQQLRQAFATIQTHADTMKGNPEVYAACTALLWQVQYRLAFVELNAGDKAQAMELLRQIVKQAGETDPTRPAANHALELLDSGKTPTLAAP